MKKILVAMSGGVDSSVAALLLKKAGYFVIGATMKLVPCGKEKTGGCCGIEAVESAKRVARKLNIPHYVLNFEKEFEQKVIKNFISEYSNGKTPNPCVKCNQYIKFPLLLKRAKELGCNFLATGHYTRLRREIRNSPDFVPTLSRMLDSVGIEDPRSLCDREKFEIRKLFKAKDKKKDQSYFLYTLNQKQLKHLIFPLASLTKKQVRQIAKKEGLPVFNRPESQEICFIEKDYREFLKSKKPSLEKEGLTLNKNGQILGKHSGIAFYTIGQRRGLKTQNSKLKTQNQNLKLKTHRSFISACGLDLKKYVIKIDAKKNALVVGPEKDLYSKELIAKDVNWVSGQPPKLPIKVLAKIRAQHQPAKAIITKSLYPKRYTLKFSSPQRAITPGQSVVFYSSTEALAKVDKGQVILGGGIIC